MDLTLTPRLLDLQQRTRRFIADEVIPLEGDGRQTRTGRPNPCARNWSSAHDAPAC
jgi:hypothetical protein